MDIDPLADRAPPRHAVESDSEDEADGGIYAPTRDTNSRKKEEELPTTVDWTSSKAPESVPDKLIMAFEQVHSALLGSFQFAGWNPFATVKLGDKEVY